LQTEESVNFTPSSMSSPANNVKSDKNMTC